jgi:hypothetical protein
MKHPELIRLIIAYTLVGAFVFTAVVTCLSLVGLVKFSDPDQQKKLFYVLIVEVVTGSVGLFFNFLSFNPEKVGNNIVARVVDDVALPLAQATTAARAEGVIFQPDLPAADEQAASSGSSAPAAPESPAEAISTKHFQERSRRDYAPSAKTKVLIRAEKSRDIRMLRLLLDNTSLDFNKSEHHVSVAHDLPHVLSWMAFGDPGARYSISVVHNENVLFTQTVTIEQQKASVGARSFQV